jgi:hypothetical protein
MLGLATELLEAAKRGDMRRGREVQQLDIGYPGSPLALEEPERVAGLLAGDRAPDAPLRGAAGQLVRLFELLRGPHWTLLGYQVNRRAVPARTRLHIHCIGPDGELIDESEHFRGAYAVSSGDWVLVRPDGYIGAFVGAQQIDALTRFLNEQGLV